MIRPETTGKKPGLGAKCNSDLPSLKDDEPPPPRLALTILEFCAAFRISDDFYYKLKRQCKGPREMKVGKRTLISLVAADEWRIEREREGAGASTAKTPAAIEHA